MKVAFVAPPVPAVPLSRLQREYYFFLFASRAFTVFDHLSKEDFDKFWMLEPVHLGLLQLISFLEQNGVACSFFAPICPDGDEAARETVLLAKLLRRAGEFDAIGFTSITASYRTAERMAAAVRAAHPDVPLILGGNHAWVRHEEVLQGGVFDVLVHQEGEETTLELLRAMAAGTPLDRVAGISFRRDGRIVKTAKRPRMDRGILPLIGYDHLEDNFDPTELGNEGRIAIPISRVTPLTGCTNSCIWCADYWKPEVTGQDLDRFAAEVSYLMAKRGSRFFYLGTHDFLHDIGRALEIAERMGTLAPQIRWEAQTRATPAVEREHLRALRQAGCRCLHIGVESADQRLLDAMGKNIRLPEVVRMFELAREEDLHTHAYWLVGSPFETYQTAMHTITTMRDWLHKDLCSTAEINMLVAYPGTEFFENGEKYGITWTATDYSQYDGRNVPSHETETLTRRDLEYLFHRAMDEYCTTMAAKIGNRKQLLTRLNDRFPNFDPAFMEAAF